MYDIPLDEIVSSDFVPTIVFPRDYLVINYNECPVHVLKEVAHDVFGDDVPINMTTKQYAGVLMLSRFNSEYRTV